MRRHYKFLAPAVKRRAAARGIDIEKSTDDFLRSIRDGHGMRRDLLERMGSLLTGPRSTRVEAIDAWYQTESTERRAA